MSSILVTGGAGYIGSHVAATLMKAGRRVVVLDDFSNSRRTALGGINAIGLGETILVEGDCRDRQLLDRVFAEQEIVGVIHLAGLKVVNDSVIDPIRYYAVNLGSATNLFETMLDHGVNRLVFSSSAAVYGTPENAPIQETAGTDPVNPYGQSKLMIEQMLTDIAASRAQFKAISLRYFNPAGAHPSVLIGEDPLLAAQSLFPIIAEVAAGKRAELRVHGNDWSTPDGSCIRDFIHVMDLAEAHRAALEYLEDNAVTNGHQTINLGTGTGLSVLGAIAAFSHAAGRQIPYSVGPRRSGDVARVVADPSRAAKMFDWQATRGLDQICRDQWAWQCKLDERC